MRSGQGALECPFSHWIQQELGYNVDGLKSYGHFLQHSSKSIQREAPLYIWASMYNIRDESLRTF